MYFAAAKDMMHSTFMWALYLHVKDEAVHINKRENVPQEQIWVIRHNPPVVSSEPTNFV
jgi:hypothetical protein